MLARIILSLYFLIKLSSRGARFSVLVSLVAAIVSTAAELLTCSYKYGCEINTQIMKLKNVTLTSQMHHKQLRALPATILLSESVLIPLSKSMYAEIYSAYET